MKKNIELYREILKILENNNEEYYALGPGEEFKVDGYYHADIVYNIKLMYEDGLLQGPKRFNGLDIVELVVKPTSEGHDFINIAKDQGLWNSFKEKMGEQLYTMPVSVMVSILKDYLQAYMKNKI